MSFETALRTRTGSAAVMAIAKSVEWDNRGDYPAVVLRTVFDDRARHMTGFQGKRYSRVQIDVLALDKPTMVALREAVIAAVAPRATVGGVAFEAIRNVSAIGRSEQGDTKFIFRDGIDAVFWWREVEV